MICKDVMTTEPVCCLADETVDIAAQLMKLEDIGSIPVIEDQETRRLIGIITDRDLAMGVVAKGRDPKHTKIRDVMTKEPLTCLEIDDVESAMAAMEDHQVRRVPIVDPSQKIIGIISQADIATRLKEPERTGEVLAKISQ